MNYRHVVNCICKKAYPDCRSASFAALSVQTASGELMDAYPCEVCDGYHVGHAMKRISPRRLEKLQSEAERKFNIAVERWRRGELADDVVRERNGVAA